MPDKITKRLLIIGLSCLVLRLPSAAAAEAPQLIRYQGQVKDVNGVDLAGPYNLTFRLYDAISAGSVIWAEAHQDVIFDKGRFSVLLGAGTLIEGSQAMNAVDWTKPLWLGVQINAEAELSPRQRIASVPIALRSESAEHLTQPITPALISQQGAGGGLDSDMLDGKHADEFIGQGDAAGGDLSGAYPSPTVDKIYGVPLSPAPPKDGQVLQYIAASGHAEWRNAAVEQAVTIPASGGQITIYNSAFTNVLFWPGSAAQTAPFYKPNNITACDIYIYAETDSSMTTWRVSYGGAVIATSSQSNYVGGTLRTIATDADISMVPSGFQPITFEARTDHASSPLIMHYAVIVFKP